jgi:hypothetical protein
MRSASSASETPAVAPCALSDIFDDDNGRASSSEPMTAQQAERLRALAARASFPQVYNESLSRFEAAQLIKALHAELGLPKPA